MNNDSDILMIDADYDISISDEDGRELQELIKEFEQCYADNKDKAVETWMEPLLKKHLPDKSQKDIHKITKEIMDSLNTTEEIHADLKKSVSKGRSKEGWFASQIKKITSAMSVHKASEYLSNLDKAVKNANDALRDTITTKTGNVSQNPNLDGFIAEQYHAQTFNMNAEAAGSEFRAKVLEPKGTQYTKNSVDVVIVDGNGKIVKRYQAKYYKDATATEKAFENGDYRGQQKLVPEDQAADINQKATDVLVAPDGTTSNPLTKNRAEILKKEAQSGNWNELNWNEYAIKDLAAGIGKQAGFAALQGAAIGAGVDVAQKLWNGEDIEAGEVIEKALESGTDFGVKAALSGALKVASEKEIISLIPKGTPVSTIANIAYVAVEDAKVVSKIATGELNVIEGMNQLEETTVSAITGLATMAKGAEIGAEIGTMLGPAGTAIGGFLGGTIGFCAGSTVGKMVVKGAQKARKTCIKIVVDIADRAKESAVKVADKVFSFGRKIFG